MVQVRKMGSEKSGPLSTIAAQNWDHGAAGSATGSSNGCQSAISRLSLASRFAEWHAAVNSWRRISSRKSRTTVMERRRTGVVEKNFFASGSGISNITCITRIYQEMRESKFIKWSLRKNLSRVSAHPNKSICGGGPSFLSFSNSGRRVCWRTLPSGVSSDCSRLDRISFARSRTALGTPARRATWMP